MHAILAKVALARRHEFFALRMYFQPLRKPDMFIIEGRTAHAAKMTNASDVCGNLENVILA